MDIRIVVGLSASGFMAVGFGSAVALHWLGFDQSTAFYYGMIGSMTIAAIVMIACVLGVFGYVAWRCLRGPG